MKDFHRPVMPAEVIHYLNLKPGQSVIDCTLGGAGHALEIIKRISPDGKFLGIDLDPLAIQVAKEAIKGSKSKVIFIQDNFKNLKAIALNNNFEKVDGILFDLGLSSGQLADHGRGFSFLAEGSLDMRFGGQTELTAGKILNLFNQKDLEAIFRNFGEEKLAKPISQEIIEARQLQPISLPAQLVEIIASVYGRYYRGKSKVNPATKVFQALRIAVNQELDNLIQVLPQALELLKPNGRLVVISYHSLEDRIVKGFLKNESRDCLCSPEMPVCQCQHQRAVRIMTKKPIEPTREEVAGNPRARSAKLRVAERLINHK
jgi:16S rRNA (cytosine1402-N4)-methyltransferase